MGPIEVILFALTLFSLAFITGFGLVAGITIGAKVVKWVFKE